MFKGRDTEPWGRDGKQWAMIFNSLLTTLGLNSFEFRGLGLQIPGRTWGGLVSPKTPRAPEGAAAGLILARGLSRPAGTWRSTWSAS